jgi:hypothetical protein
MSGQIGGNWNQAAGLAGKVLERNRSEIAVNERGSSDGHIPATTTGTSKFVWQPTIQRHHVGMPNGQQPPNTAQVTSPRNREIVFSNAND